MLFMFYGYHHITPLMFSDTLSAPGDTKGEGKLPDHPGAERVSENIKGVNVVIPVKHKIACVQSDESTVEMQMNKNGKS